MIKVELLKWLAERLRRYAAEKYGLRREALSKAVVEILERELGYPQPSAGGWIVVELGLSSPRRWNGEDLAEALRDASD